MPHRRARSASDLVHDHSDDETENLIFCSTKSDGFNLNRRASQGCTRTLIHGFSSRPETPTRILESSLRISSSSNLNRTPKSVRFKFPEQDHFEALALARKSKEAEILDQQLKSTQVQQVQEVTKTIKENIAKLLDKESRLDLDSSGDIADQPNTTSSKYYFQIGQNVTKKIEWYRTRTWLIPTAIVVTVICILLVLALISIYL